MSVSLLCSFVLSIHSGQEWIHIRRKMLKKYQFNKLFFNELRENRFFSLLLLNQLLLRNNDTAHLDIMGGPGTSVDMLRLQLFLPNRQREGWLGR